MDNPRQEIDFAFAGKSIKLRPTFQVINAIELATGQSSRTLGLRLLRSECSMGEVARIIEIVFKSKNIDMSYNQIGDELVDAGYGELILPLGDFLLRAVKGNRKHEEEARAAANGHADPPQTAASTSNGT